MGFRLLVVLVVGIVFGRSIDLQLGHQRIFVFCTVPVYVEVGGTFYDRSFC